MSASDPNSKIDVLDDAASVTSKIKKAFAQTQVTEGNGLLAFIEYVLLPISALQSSDGKPSMTFKPREGEPLVYSNIDEIRQAYAADTVTPQLLKSGVSDTLNGILAPIQAEFQADKEWQQALEEGYPTEQPEKKKKDKKPKDKGSRYPGGAKVTTNPDGTIEGPDAEKVNIGESVEDALSNLAVKNP